MKRKNRMLALVLAMFFGFLALDRFYLGKIKSGFLKLVTIGGFGIWWFIDVAMLLMDAFFYSLGREGGFVKDKRGQDLRYGLSAYRMKSGSWQQDWFTEDASTLAASPDSDGIVKPVPSKSWMGRNWKWAIPTAILGMVAAIIIGTLSTMKSSEVYQRSMAAVKDDDRVTDVLGTDISAGYFVSGQVSNTAADFVIPVSGSKGEGKVYVQAVNMNGQWIFQNVVLHTDNEDVDLLAD